MNTSLFPMKSALAARPAIRRLGRRTAAFAILLGATQTGCSSDHSGAGTGANDAIRIPSLRQLQFITKTVAAAKDSRIVSPENSVATVSGPSDAPSQARSSESRPLFFSTAADGAGLPTTQPAPTTIATTTATTSATLPETLPIAVPPEVAALKRMSIEELMSLKVATVTAASKQPERVTDTPATTIVINQRDIRLRGYTNLKDVLRDLPGMETAENYFSEIGTQVPVRGLSGNNKIVVLVNGMRVNPPGGEFFPFRSDFSVRGAEQVEVVYGPGSTLYGQDAIAAVINVKTKELPDGHNGEFAIDGGMYGERDGWLMLGGKFGSDHQIKLTGYVQYHDSELTRIDKDYSDWWQDFANASAQLKPAHLGDPPDRQDFGLNAFGRLEVGNLSLQVWHRQSQRSSAEGYSTGAPSVPGTLPFSGLAYAEEARWGDQSTVAEARYVIPVSKTLSFESAFTYNSFEINPSSKYVFQSAGTNPTNWFLNDFKYGAGSSYTFEETMRWKIAPTLNLLGGVFAGSYDIIPKSTIPGGADTSQSIAKQGGNFVYTDGSGTHAVPRVTESNYTQYAGYLELGWQVTPRLRVLGGARITWDSRIEDEDVPITPRASIIYEIADGLTAKYIFTQAFVAPAPYFDASYDRGDVLARPNPDGLQPERATSHELNLTYTRRNLELGASAYYGKQSNLIIVSDRAIPGINVVETGIFMPDGTTRNLVQSENGGKSHNTGFDIYGRATFGDFSPWASYSYVDFEQTLPDGSTTGLPGISRHNGRLGVTWAATSRLFITPSLVIRSMPENVQNPKHLKSELETPYEINLHVLYQATDNMHFYLDVRNITNHRYALGNFIGSASPQEGIHGVIGLQIDF
jgi:outer membrane receptor protein involved in Fe transport